MYSNAQSWLIDCDTMSPFINHQSDLILFLYDNQTSFNSVCFEKRIIDTVYEQCNT